MRNTFFKIITALFIIASTTSFAQEKEKDYSLAKVGKKIEGVYIYFWAEPYNEYSFVKKVKVKAKWWESGDVELSRLIKKAKKKAPYFNGIIFRAELKTCELIRFEGLSSGRGGVAIGQEVSFIKGGKMHYGKVVELQSKKKKGTVSYLIDGVESLIRLQYDDMIPVKKKD